MRSPKWFQIGFKFKRWLISGVVGVLLLIAALFILIKDTDIPHTIWLSSLILGIVGVYAIILCLRNIFLKFVSVYSNGKMGKPSNVTEVSSIIYKRKILASEPMVVVIGGGTGTSTILRGLKAYTSNIAAIVTVADDGGGSGALRNDLGILPPGDIRNCMIALADTEPVLERLLKYRFTEGSLKGQCFGNLFLAAMHGISDGFEDAVHNMGNVLAITGKVYPVTEDNVFLVAELEDGTQIRGESRIGSHNFTHPGRIKRVMLDKDKALPVKKAIETIEKADVIVLGPGSLYTSIIPNLLVDGVSKAIAKSRAKKIYVSNIMTQPGETDGYSVSDHIKAIHYHTGEPVIDICIVNSGKIPFYVQKKYEKDDAQMVSIDYDNIKKLGIRIIEKNLVSVNNNNLVRHDSNVLAHTILDVTKNQ